MTTLDDRPAETADPLAGPEALNIPGVTGKPGTALAVRKTMSMAEKVHWAEQMARSSLLPKDFARQPANLLWALEYAEALHLPNIAAITGVHVMDGKPTPSAALMSALVRRAQHRCRISYVHDPDGPGGFGYGLCRIIRFDDPEFTYEARWDVNDAVRALLCTIKDGKPYSRSERGKPQNWEKYTRNMLKWRALSECARDACEEALLGMHYLADELGADTDDDGNPIFIEGEVVHRADARREDIAPKLVGDPDPETEPNWDERIARHIAEDDADALVKLYKWAQHLRPNDAALQERIAREGAQARARAEAKTAQKAAESPQDAPAGTETPAAAGSAASGDEGQQDGASQAPGTEYPDGTVAAEVVDPDDSDDSDDFGGEPPAGSAAGDEVDAHEAADHAEAQAPRGFELPAPPPYAKHNNEPAPQSRHAAIMGLLSRVQGMRSIDDDTRRAFFTGMLRRGVSSQKRVTAEEAGWLIQALVKAQKAGELGELVHAALGRPLPDPDPFAGLPDPSEDEQGWHDAEHPVWRRAQLDTAHRSPEDCSLCAQAPGRDTGEEHGWDAQGVNPQSGK